MKLNVQHSTDNIIIEDTIYDTTADYVVSDNGMLIVSHEMEEIEIVDTYAPGHWSYARWVKSEEEQA